MNCPLSISAMMMTIVLLILCVLHSTDASRLQVEAEPPDINMIDNKPLVVNCTYRHDPNQTTAAVDVSMIQRITLSKHDQIVNSVLTTISTSSPNAPTLAAGIASAKGHLSQERNGESYLSITWSSPGIEEQGIYVCTAHTTDRLGVAMDISQQVTVRDDTYLVLQQRLKSFENDIIQQRECCRLASAGLVEFGVWRETISTAMKYFQSTLLFLRSSEYKNHTYFVDKYKVEDFAVAQAVCRTMGGYLAEVEDADEWAFVKGFLKSGNFTNVLVGGRDDIAEGIWYWNNSERPLTFGPWGHGEPNNSGNEDCLEIVFIRPTFAYNDISCTSKGRYSFLCEVPSSTVRHP